MKAEALLREIIDTEYERCIIRRNVGGCTEIVCRLGLWSVMGSDAAMIEKGARHYWIQYYEDGEYAKLLTSK